MTKTSMSLAVAVLMSSASFVPGGAVAGDEHKMASFEPVYYGSCHKNVEPFAAEPAAAMGTPEVQLKEETRLMRDTLKGVEAAQDCYTTALSAAQSARKMDGANREIAVAQLSEIKAGTREVGVILAKATSHYSERADALAPQVTSSLAPAAGEGMMAKDEKSMSSMDILKEREDLLDKAKAIKARQKKLEEKAKMAQ